jgi:hypothetical protein
VSPAADRAVRLAVALLPKRARERYREQWAGELRDAATLDIRQSEIATGALRVAASVERPMPAWFRMTPPRLALALALSAALVSLSEWVSMVPVQRFTGPSWEIEPGSIGTSPLIAWVVVVPAVAVILAMASRRTSARARFSVGLLAVACYLPFLRHAIDDRVPSASWTPYFSTGTATYAIAAVLTVIAMFLSWRELHPRVWTAQELAARTRVLRAGLAAAAVAVVVATCSLNAFAAWASRTPPAFGQPVSMANRMEFEQWVTLKVQAETFVANLLTGWVVAGIVAALLVAAFGFSTRSTLKRTGALALGTLCVALISHGGVILFLQMMTVTTVAPVPADIPLTAGRIGVIVVVLFAVGWDRAAGQSAVPQSSAVEDLLSMA